MNPISFVPNGTTDSMRFKKIGQVYFLRIDRGEEIVASLAQFCSDERISLGTVQGIGAADRIVIGLFETATRTYRTTTLAGDYEITSLLGTITTKDDLPYLHLHATLSDALHRAFGGHLTSAVVSGTCEIMLQVQDGRIGRTFDEEVGLNVMDL